MLTVVLIPSLQSVVPELTSGVNGVVIALSDRAGRDEIRSTKAGYLPGKTARTW